MSQWEYNTGPDRTFYHFIQFLNSINQTTVLDNPSLKTKFESITDAT